MNKEVFCQTFVRMSGGRGAHSQIDRQTGRKTDRHRGPSSLGGREGGYWQDETMAGGPKLGNVVNLTLSQREDCFPS